MGAALFSPASPRRPALQGRRVAVYGLGKSGLAAVELLLREGAGVTAVDERSLAELGDTLAPLQKKVAVALGPVPADLLGRMDLVVTSPGVPWAKPVLQQARQAGVPVWGEVELAWRFLGPGPVVGITGTNGKSTTTALCGELFRAAGQNAFVGGNLGRPLCLATAEPHSAYVVELSSFQLESADAMRVNAAAILNLTPDHLDRYADAAAYGRAKARIFRNQAPPDVAVVNAEDDAVVGLARGAPVPVYGFALKTPPRAPGLAGFALATPEGFAFDFAPARFVLRNPALRGAHNVQNAMAAALLAHHSGLSTEAIQRGLDAYPGLPHRMESVRTLAGVEWINDSKATNVDAALVALRAFARGVWLIAGGRGKGAPYQPLVEASVGRVCGVLTLGEDAPRIAQAFQGRVPTHPCPDLAAAVARARELAKEGDVVLLSPACASYDQFKNFEERGDVFRRLVKGLA